MEIRNFFKAFDIFFTDIKIVDMVIEHPHKKSRNVVFHADNYDEWDMLIHADDYDWGDCFLHYFNIYDDKLFVICKDLWNI